jgi:hypothetical protein
MRQWSVYFRRFSNAVVRFRGNCGVAIVIIKIRRKGKGFYVYKQRGEKLLNAS